MQHVQELVMERLEQALRNVGYQPSVVFEWANVGTIVLLDPSSLASVGSIKFRFSNEKATFEPRRADGNSTLDCKIWMDLGTPPDRATHDLPTTIDHVLAELVADHPCTGEWHYDHVSHNGVTCPVHETKE